MKGRDKNLKSKTNQDSFICDQTVSSIVTLYGVFDGHGANGHNVSNYVAKRLPSIITNLQKVYLRNKL